MVGIFIPVVIFIITAVSNGANLTDGIDGWPQARLRS
jgi:UDP-N-acetylmuramyl pentapeptide phosphotransferase/UDP-N-acetylglucosamine-1-phosphate transferase